jgi:hypothetical protein
MSRIRFLRHWVAFATFGALASAGCFVVEDTDGDDDDDDNGGEAGESNGGSSTGGRSTGGRGGSAPSGGSENGGSSTGGSSTGGSESGGSSTGGGPPAGGSSTGGSSTGGSSTGGSGPGEGAVMKFCNELYRNGTEAAPLTVVFAGVRATAVSGTCEPVVPNPCIAIPTVTNPTVALLDGTTEIISGAINDFVVADGDEVIVIATIDEKATEPGPTVQAGIFLPEFVCSETDPFAEMLETKSAHFSLPLDRNLRSELRPAVTTWSKKRSF